MTLVGIAAIIAALAKLVKESAAAIHLLRPSGRGPDRSAAPSKTVIPAKAGIAAGEERSR
jgi:hypothetical protein